jgi:Putative transposase/Transposase zinc-binding domain
MLTETVKPVTVQQILQHYHKTSSHPHVHHVITQLKKCKTSEMGYHLYKCNDDDCAQYKYQYHGCRNRHCPQCGGFKKDQWIEDRRRELLPVGYYHVVFTLPHQLNTIILGNRQQLFKLLFNASAQTLLAFGNDERHLGASPGIISVLHTWGQDLNFHPHVHCIVSGGGTVKNTGGSYTWKNAKRIKDNFLFPVNAMRIVFRAKFLQGLKSINENKLIHLPEGYNLQNLINILYKKKWNLYAKAPCAGPQQVIEYLGRYSNKVAISNYRIMDNQNGNVLFKYKDYADGDTTKLMTLKGQEFVRRFEQHILPKRFIKIRSYGYLCNRERIGRMGKITLAMDIPPHPPKVRTPWTVRLFEKFGIKHTTCSHCKKESLQLVGVIYPTRVEKKQNVCNTFSNTGSQEAVTVVYNDS